MKKTIVGKTFKLNDRVKRSKWFGTWPEFITVEGIDFERFYDCKDLWVISYYRLRRYYVEA